MLDFIALAAENYGIVENLKTHGVTVTLSGLIIVFSMLLLLVCIIGVFGIVMVKLSRTSAPKNDKVKNAEPVKVATPTVSDDAACDDGVIAAISAAVMMMYEGTGKTPVIRSIKPAQKGVRSVWANAGIMNNTRPF